MNHSTMKFSCIILAGGEGKRVGGRDKGLIDFWGKPLIQHVLDIVAPQTDEIIISANRNIKNYERYGYRIISDTCEQHHGPLAGIAACLPSCKNDWVLVVPCDMPSLPGNIVLTLAENMAGKNVCIAESENRLQLVFLIHKKLQPSLLQALQNNQLSVMQWIKSQQASVVKNFKPLNFQNINHSGELIDN